SAPRELPQRECAKSQPDAECESTSAADPAENRRRAPSVESDTVPIPPRAARLPPPRRAFHIRPAPAAQPESSPSQLRSIPASIPSAPRRPLGFLSATPLPASILCRREKWETAICPIRAGCKANRES